MAEGVLRGKDCECTWTVLAVCALWFYAFSLLSAISIFFSRWSKLTVNLSMTIIHRVWKCWVVYFTPIVKDWLVLMFQFAPLVQFFIPPIISRGDPTKLKSHSWKLVCMSGIPSVYSLEKLNLTYLRNLCDFRAFRVIHKNTLLHSRQIST